MARRRAELRPLARLLTVGSVALIAAVLAAPSASAAVPKRVCSLPGDRLAELSGLASDGKHWFAVNDGGTQVEVVVLNRKCVEQRTITADVDPYDVEDLALADDGTLWLADTGDNDKDRDTVAVIQVTPDGRASLHRLSYPDGQHDAEALLLDRAGRPYIVTKNVVGQSQVYRPSGKLRSPGPTPLTKVADVNFAATDTPGGPRAAGGIASILVTGGAVSHDGKVIALRTYTDAYLYPAPDGNFVTALRQTPVRVPLPNEEQGEAIAFEPNGTLLSGGEGSRQPIRAVRAATAKVAPDPVAEPGDDRDTPSSTSNDGANTSPLPALAITAVAALLLWFGIGRLQRRRR
jgi:hypothetical protein